MILIYIIRILIKIITKINYIMINAMREKNNLTCHNITQYSNINKHNIIKHKLLVGNIARHHLTDYLYSESFFACKDLLFICSKY